MERGLWGRIDNFLGDALKECDEIFETGRPPRFSGDSLIALRHTFAALIKRAPEARSKYDPTTVGEEIRDAVIGDAKEKWVEPDEGIIDLTTPTNLKQIGQHIISSAVAGEPTEILNELCDFDAKWIIAPQRKSFIIGSRTVLIVGNGGSGRLDDPKTELLLAVSPSLMIALTRNKSVPLLNSAQTAWVREKNLLLCSMRSEVASGTRKLLTSLVGRNKSA